MSSVLLSIPIGMCGILGIVASTNSRLSLSEQAVVRMRDRMAARGPDDATLLAVDNIVFAHRRLAIRDQAGGRQPVSSPNGRFVITYNGEIYNDGPLRNELLELGYRFSSRCDTDVLAAAWQAWNSDCVSKLRGMFAFAVYDLRKRTLTLVRDRFGIKPLFYAEINNEVVFASTIAAIKQHPNFSASPNLSTLRHYLSTLRLTFGEQTVFEGISTVRPAEIVTFQNGRPCKTTYWTPPRADASLDIRFDEAVDELESTLRDSVSMRMVSDVPVGMMLSGGVDSNSLAYLIKDNTQSSFAARCGGGSDPAFQDDDSDFVFARECARHNDLNFAEVTVESDAYLNGWEHLVDEYETPVSTPTDVIINRIANDLRNAVGVALGGEGADEACCGYQIPHWSGADFDLLNSMDSLQTSEAKIASLSLQQQYGDRKHLSPGALYLACNGLIPPGAQRGLMRPSVWRSDKGEAIESYYDKLFRRLEGMQTSEKTAHVLLQTNLESLLSRLDSATMLEGLECRVPYTDHVLIEQLFRLPLSYRIDVCPSESSPWRSSLDLAQRGSLRPKRLIHALADRLMPSRLARRPKASFPTPVPIWLQSNWRSWIERKLSQSEFARAIFEPAALRQLTRMPADLSMWNWPIMNIVLWGDQCFG